jgi:hemophore-related protein
VAQGYLRQFLAAPPAQRQQLAQQALAVPGASQQVGLVLSLAGTCNNY